jgi:hypothetical protein
VVGGQDQDLNLDKLPERLRAMTDAKLLEFGQAAAYLVTAAATWGKPPCLEFVT